MISRITQEADADGRSVRMVFLATWSASSWASLAR
jgi:hypothetical protein